MLDSSIIRLKSKVGLTAISLAVLALLVCPASQAKGSANDKMQLGELLYFNGNVEGAIRCFKKAIQMKPNMWQAHLNLVNIYIQQNKFDEAIEECNEVLKCKPKHKDVHLILGNLKRAQNDLDGAIESLEKALECGASPAMTHNALGLSHLQKGNIDKAHFHIGQALEKKDKFPEAHLAMGVLHVKKGNKAAALESMDKAIKHKGKNAEARNAKGDILASDGKWKEALEEYKLATKDDPKYAQAWSSIGNAEVQLAGSKDEELNKEEHFDEADKAFKKALDLNPSDKNAKYGLAIICQKRGHLQDAIYYFQGAVMLETDPTMKAQITAHINNLRNQGSFFNVPGVGGGAGGGAGLPGMGGGNPFGQSFADLIKVNAPTVEPKKKKKVSEESTEVNQDPSSSKPAKSAKSQLGAPVY